MFGAKIKCGDCGAWYGSKTWHSTDKYKTVVWQCNCKFDKNKPRCETSHITEDEIKERFLKAFNSMIADKAPYIEACAAVKAVLADTSAIDTEMRELLREMEVVAALTKKCIEENSSMAQDQEAYTARYNGYVERYEKVKS